MTELDVSPSDYDTAATSHDAFLLKQMAEHQSRYIRARVTGNPHTPRHVRDQLRKNPREHSGLLLWLLGNPACTREEFTLIFHDYAGRAYESNVHLALASCHHATESELAKLLLLHEWSVTLAVLNNYRGRDATAYRTLIKAFVPDDDIPPKTWNEIQKLAYLRTYGTRLPEGSG